MKNRLGCFFILLVVYLLPGNASAQGLPAIAQSSDVYIYNNGKDTLFLPEISDARFCSCDPVKVMDTIQVNGKGAKEIVLYRNCTCIKEEHGGTFDISEHKAMSKYEVWDVDTKVLLFESVNSFMQSYNRFIANATPSRQQGKSAYKYDFSIDKKGVIMIKNGPDEDEQQPDHEDGIYKYVNGKYMKQ